MKKTLMIIGGVVLGLVIIGGAIFLYLTTTSKKLVCKSKEGNITILYNKKITGYTTTGNISFDIDNQNAYVEKNGIEAYLTQYSASYANNTTGTCVKK